MTEGGIKRFVKCYTCERFPLYTLWQKNSKWSFWPREVLPVPILHSNPTHHHLVCLLPEARIAASWQIVGEGRPGSALPAGVAGAPSELQPLLVLTANAVFMRIEAASADQEIRPCDIALRKANKDAINGLKTSKGRLYPRSACRLEDHRIFNSSSAAYHYWTAAGRRTLSIVSWYASSFWLVVGWKELKITCICFILIITFNNVILCCISLRYGATKLNDQHPPAKYNQRG